MIILKIVRGSYVGSYSSLCLTISSVIENSYETKRGETKTEFTVYNNAQNASKSSVILISTHLFGDFNDFDDFWDENNDLIAEHGSIIHGSTPSLADNFLVQELKWIHEIYLEMTDDKKFTNIFAFDRRIPFDRDILRSGLLLLPVCFPEMSIPRSL
jgi:hypothetical protein